MTEITSSDAGQWALSTYLPIAATQKQADGKNRNVYCGDVPIHYPLLSQVIALPDGVTEEVIVHSKTDGGNERKRAKYSDERLQALWDGLATAIEGKVRSGAKGDPATQTIEILREAPRNWGEYLTPASGGGEYMRVRAATITALKQMFAQLIKAGRASQAGADMLIKLLGNESALRTSDPDTKDKAKRVLDTLLANIPEAEQREYLSTYTDRLYEAIAYDAKADLLSINLDF